jgi:hypothetical protein
MKSQLLKDDKIDRIVRNVKIPCVECGSVLKFRIENEIVVEGEGRIVCNIPGAVCHDCIDSVLIRWQIHLVFVVSKNYLLS